jgi:Uma2 family endonuclease
MTLQDLVDRLGGIPLSRILARPAPGLATEADLIAVNDKKERICELVDGMLVEKAVGFRQSVLAARLSAALLGFVRDRRLGIVTGAKGAFRLSPGLVRASDVAFYSWQAFPGHRIPDEPIPQVVPALVIEVLRQSNTEAEMERKRREYFEAGVRVIWLVDPQNRTVMAYEKQMDNPREYGQTSTIEDLDFLVGFQLKIGDFFATLDRPEGSSSTA